MWVDMIGPVRSVSQAFTVLRLLAERDSLTLTEVSRAAGLSASSCLNLLRTLEGEGVLTRGASSKKYRLASEWQAVDALRDNSLARLVEQARPLMSDLAQRSEAAVGLWKAISRDRMQLVVHAESDAGMRLRLADEQRQPLGGGAVGRALAAFQQVDEDELERRFDHVRWRAPLSFGEYRQQVSEAAQKGFATDAGYAHKGVTTVARALGGRYADYCLSASVVIGAGNSAEISGLGAALVELGTALA